MQSLQLSVIIAEDPTKKFHLRLEGSSIHRQLCRPADLLPYASVSFAVHHRFLLHYCSECRQHHRLNSNSSLRCLSTLLLDIAASTIFTMWQFYTIADILTLENYCILDKSYTWSLSVSLFVPPSFAPAHLSDCIDLLFDKPQYNHIHLPFFALAFVH